MCKYRYMKERSRLVKLGCIVNKQTKREKKIYIVGYKNQHLAINSNVTCIKVVAKFAVYKTSKNIYI